MFGDRKKLILPLVFDIANLVKTAAIHGNKRYPEYSPYPPARNEMMPQPEFLRRNDVIQDATFYRNESVASLLTSQRSPVNNIKDDRFLVDIGEGRVKSVVTESSTEKNTHNRPSLPQTTDNRSYHERKLNMTAFNVNGTKDQYAVESTVQLQIALPKRHENRPNMTLEEYEELAFHQLNGTMRSSNGTSVESLPIPEMLISRYRVKPPFRKFPQPSTGSSIDSNGKTCERFGTLCLRVDDYPMTQIMGSIRRHKHAMSALLAEFTDKEDYDYTTYLQELQETNSKR